jgi:glycosyltransferase involved in cell wall biosynthesis
MRIVFIVLGNSRRSNYLTGETLRYGGGGGSGTDTSSIVAAECLAKAGHEVVFAFDKLEPQLEESYEKFVPGTKINGVQYTFRETFEGIDNLEFDVLISSLWFQDYENMPIKISKALIYWSHMQWVYGLDEMIRYVNNNDLNFAFVHISSWQKEMVQGCVDHMKNNMKNFKKEVLIPNPIMDDIVKEVESLNIVRKPHKFIFHASWARGGNVAHEVVKRLPYEDKELHAFDYLMTIHDHRDSFFHIHQGVDKLSLFKHLAESEYFLYPLYTPYQDVHKDTFSCVVAEAIAMGTIVLTYPLGALPENFSEYCVWVDPPKGMTQEDLANMQKDSLSKDLEGRFRDNEEAFVEKIKYLEENPQIKQKYKSGGNYIIESFNAEKVGNMWNELIHDL